MSLNSSSRDSVSAGYMFAIVAVIVWSGNFLIARGATELLPPITLAFLRWSVAFIAILPFALGKFRQDWAVIKQHLPYLAVVSVLGVSLFNTLIYFAGHTSPALNMSLISITSPIFIMIFARIYFQEAITINKLFGIVMVATGIIVLLSKGDVASLMDIRFSIGDVWMLLAAGSWAVYSILLKKKPEGISVWSFQLSTFALGLVFLAPFYLWEASHTAPIEITEQLLLILVYLGVFASLTAFLLWNKAVNVLGPAKASMVYYTLPIFSGLLAAIFLQEAIASFHLICGGLIISGIVLANSQFSRSNKEQRTTETFSCLNEATETQIESPIEEPMTELMQSMTNPVTQVSTPCSLSSSTKSSIKAG